MSKQDTDNHLAWRYTGSCARVILSLLDPSNHLGDVSDAYASIFAGNNVFLADIPSGSGAAVVSILSTLFELRQKSILPRHPLNISIVAGEISPTARSYLQEQLKVLSSHLEKQAISIKYEITNWDVLNSFSTADLIKKITISSQSSSSRLLIVSNFSGALGGSLNWQNAQPKFDEIFRHSRDLNSYAIWIEPQINKAKKTFSKVFKWFKDNFYSILGLDKNGPSEESSRNESQSESRHPITKEQFTVRLTIMKFDLPLEKAE